MSELTNTNRSRRDFRLHLLCSVSAVTLIASAADATANDDADHPTIWIELGGQLERVDSARAIFTPPFFDKASASVLAPMVDAQIAPQYSIGGEAQLTFEPHDTDWVFTASLRYGRSSAQRHLHYQSNPPDVPFTIFGVPKTPFPQAEFGDGQSQLKASHVVLDFQAGKDIGLGMFGPGSTSIFSVGVRFAQFASSLDATLHAEPLYALGAAKYKQGKYNIHTRYLSNNSALIDTRRSTRAIGPSVSWAASAPVAGNSSSMVVAVDWGLNVALLFGRQRARVHHQTSGAYFRGFSAGNYGHVGKMSSYAHGPDNHTRSRTVTIPNVGGFAGVSFRYLDAKLKFGYRADFFFGAMDGGIDTAKKENIGFYGPFATISIGLGG